MPRGKPWTDAELEETAKIIRKYGNVTVAARALGVSPKTLQGRWAAAQARLKGRPDSAVNQPTAPLYAAPDGYLVKGTSTLIGDDGQVKQQWIKTGIDGEKFKAMVDASCRAHAEGLTPLKATKAPRIADADLCSLYTMTDCHVGMKAWERETGEPWDLDIAEQCLTDTFLQMVRGAPDSALGIFNQLGDFAHWDGMKAITPEHGHLLDADSRFQKTIEVVVRIIERMILAMLEKHQRVHVMCNEGNHDPAASAWMRVFYARVFRGNKRVTVEQSPLPFVYVQHGKTLLGFHHGHKVGTGQLPLFFASKFPQAWGATTKRYIHTGHRHHVDEKEHPGVKVIQHPTLAAPDAHSARGGWLSEREAKRIDYHLERGEYARATFLPAVA